MVANLMIKELSMLVSVSWLWGQKIEITNKYVRFLHHKIADDMAGFGDRILVAYCMCPPCELMEYYYYQMDPRMALGTITLHMRDCCWGMGRQTTCSDAGDCHFLEGHCHVATLELFFFLFFNELRESLITLHFCPLKSESDEYLHSPSECGIR